MLNEETDYNHPVENAYSMLVLYRNSVGDDNEEAVFTVVMKLMEEAFASNLSGENEIKGFAVYGNALIFRALSLREADAILDTGISCSDFIVKGINAIETSLKKDAEYGLNFFRDETNRYALLDERIGEVWVWHSVYLKEKFGNKHAINYLYEKINLIQCLGVPHFPCVSLHLAIYLNEECHGDTARQWFNYAVNTESFADDKISIECKERAAQALWEDAESRQ